MTHLNYAITGTGVVVQHTFFQSVLPKLVVSFFSILTGLILDGNEFIIGSIFLIYFIDLITGVWYALYSKDFQSRKLFAGCTKLLVYAIFMIIAVSVGNGLYIGNSLLSGIFGFILVTDSISIVENLEKLGYNTPFVLKKYLKDYQETLKNNKLDNEK